MVIPGHDDLPSKSISANPIPEGGQVGKVVELSNARKYPSRAAA
jgi:hypothetical protein